MALLDTNLRHTQKGTLGAWAIGLRHACKSLKKKQFYTQQNRHSGQLSKIDMSMARPANQDDPDPGVSRTTLSIARGYLRLEIVFRLGILNIPIVAACSEPGWLR
jgi:hypothetical protein